MLAAVAVSGQNATCSNREYLPKFGSCWKILQNSQEFPDGMNFMNAVFECTQDAGGNSHGNPAVIYNEEQDTYINALGTTGNWDFAWIGAVCQKNQWVWLSTQAPISSMGYQNFFNPANASHCEEDECLAIAGLASQGDDKWHIRKCDDKIKTAVCQIPIATPPPTPAVPFTCYAPWQLHDNACWKILENPQTDWSKATELCGSDPKARNGKLAKISSKADNDYAASFGDGWSLSWIGAFCSNGQWVWDDKELTPVLSGYANFEAGANPGSCADKTCLVLKGLKHGGVWEPTDCSVPLRNAICNWHFSDAPVKPAVPPDENSLKGFAIGFPVGMIGAGMAAAFFIWKRKRTSDTPLSAAMSEDSSPYAACSTYDNTTPDAIELKSTTSTAHAATL